MRRAVWIMVPAALAVGLVGGLMPAAAAATRHACAAGAAASARACFPKTMTGSFSGENREFKWQGTVALTAHRRQTTYAYRGRAKYTWTLKNPVAGFGGECRLSPASGTINERVAVAVSITRDRKRGWSYSGGNGAGGITGKIDRVCPDGTANALPDGIEDVDDSGLGGITQAFNPGGFSRNLRRFAGSDDQGAYRFAWSFRGKGKTGCKRRRR